MSATTPASEPGRPATAGPPKRVPLRDGTVELPAAPGDLPRLLGVRCPACGARFATPRVICLQCAHRGLERCTLSPTGTVWTFTIVHQQPPGSVMQVPYAIAQVELDDGPIVSAALVDTPLDTVRVGLPVEMTLLTVRRDEDGNEVVAHAFRARREAP